MKIFQGFSKHEYIDVKDGQKKHKHFLAATLRMTNNGGIYLRMHNNPSVQFHFMEIELPAQASTDIPADTI